MTKGLQALERIKSHYNDKVYVDVLDDFDIIETALKEYEKIEDSLPLDNNDNKLKALEIIKECFYINGFDEFVPNIKWYDEKNEDKRKLIYGVFKEALS